jgi:zinc transport system substrate-binding protein
MRGRLVYSIRAVALFTIWVLCFSWSHGACLASGTVNVSVGIPPLAYLVERIGGERVSASTLVVSGQDPHTFEPTPRQVMALTGADVYFSVGLPFEDRLLSKIAGAGSRLVVVDTAQAIKCEPQEAFPGEPASFDEHGPTHGHALPEADHLDHADHDAHDDPHVWLSPAHLMVQARTIADALMTLDPMHAAEYERNLLNLLDDIAEVDGSIRAELRPLRGREFLIYHSALSHFAETYGLVEISIETDGKSPGAKALESIIERARASRIGVVFVQPQFDSSVARLIAEALGADVVSIDPLGKDILFNLSSIAASLAYAMRD